MSEPLLTIRSALADAVVPDHYGAVGETGTTLTNLTGLSLASISARKGSTAALSAVVEREFGAPLPTRPCRTAHGSVAFVWSGCDQWLAIAAPADDLPRRLVSCAGTLGSVTDLTGSRAIIRLAGPRARDGLMKLVPIDLDETVFTTGSAASTIAAHIPVQLWQVDVSPTYEIASPRSYGTSLWRAMMAALAEYGCAVLETPPQR